MNYDTIPFSRSIDLLVPISNFLSQMEFSVIALCLQSILSQLTTPAVRVYACLSRGILAEIKSDD